MINILASRAMGLSCFFLFIFLFGSFVCFVFFTCEKDPSNFCYCYLEINWKLIFFDGVA